MAKFVPIVPKEDPGGSLWPGDDKKDNKKDSTGGGIFLSGYGPGGQGKSFQDTTEMNGWFKRLVYRNDPQLKPLLALMGISGTSKADIKLAQAIWSDLARETFSLYKGGKKRVDVLTVLQSERFKKYGLDIPKSLISGSRTAGPTRQDYINITDKKDAKDILRQTMFDLIGRAPTDEEYAQFTKRLNNLENKFFKSTQYGPTGQRTTGRNIDPKLIAERFVLRKTDFAQDLEGEAGSIQDTINQLINMNGLNGFITEKRKKELVRSLVRGELKQDGLNALLRDESKKIYKAFASMLDANPTASLYDVADPYISVYASMFEMGEAQIDIKDVLKKATKIDDKGNESVMSIFEFEKMLRTDPRFQSTGKARAEASDLATGFARAFGVNL